VGPLTVIGLIIAVVYAGAFGWRAFFLYSWAFSCLHRVPEMLLSAFLLALPLLAPPPYESYVTRRLRPAHALAAALGNTFLALFLIPAAVAAGGVLAIPLAIGLATAISATTLLTARGAKRLKPRSRVPSRRGNKTA